MLRDPANDQSDPDATEPITVLIADDQEIVRRGLSDFLSDAPGLRVVGQAGTGREAVRLAARLGPDVVLMDLRMPDGDGLWAGEQILASPAPARILVLTTFDLDEYLFAAMDLGAAGFANKDLDLDELAEAVRTVADGGCWLSPGVAARLAGEFARRRPAGASGGADPRTLTSRERQVAALVAEGLSNQQIARRLGLEVTTVKAHIGSILTRLDMTNRVQVAIWAHDHRL